MLRPVRTLIVGIPAAALIAITVAPAAGAPPAYSYRGVTATCGIDEVNSITNAGVILGTEFTCTRHRDGRGFIERNGNVRTFRRPGPPLLSTLSTGISNDAKYIVLYTQRYSNEPLTSYLRRNGNYHKLSDPKAGKKGTYVQSVNNDKEIVGQYFTGETFKHYHGFILRQGKYHTLHLGVKSAVNEAITDVNDHGDLAGYFQDKHHRYHGFLIEAGKTRVINAPGAGHKKGLGTVVGSMSENGTYCGDVIFKHGRTMTRHGFVHRQGKYQTIKVPKSFHGRDTRALTCNDAGAVGGNYQEGNAFTDRAYVATPNP